MLIFFYFFQDYPTEFAMFLCYAKTLRFEERPDYMYLRKIFHILFRSLNYQYDYKFDWSTMMKKPENSMPITIRRVETPLNQ